jgi:hypothetical protein
MKKIVGLWIDHRRASIVFVKDDKEESKLIESNVEKQGGRFDGVRSKTPYESQLVPADDSREKSFNSHLTSYYDEVISCIRDQDAILIFGPGEAKGELKKRIEKIGLGERVVGIETIDKITDRQIAEKVRNYFKEKHPQHTKTSG